MPAIDENSQFRGQIYVNEEGFIAFTEKEGQILQHDTETGQPVKEISGITQDVRKYINDYPKALNSLYDQKIFSENGQIHISDMVKWLDYLAGSKSLEGDEAIKAHTIGDDN